MSDTETLPIPETGTDWDINQLVRENIKALKPYRSARDDFSSGILLDANENAYGSPFEKESELNRYPDPYQTEFREKYAQFRGIRKEQVFTGVGSDEAIDLLIRIFCEPGRDRILITPPTYGMYSVASAANNTAIDKVLLTENFQLDPEKVLEAVTPETRLLFLCSPNNPTGNTLEPEAIAHILANFNGIVVVDEAYIDFSAQPSLAGWLQYFSNLVVLQTLSKSFGLAGIRLGVALGSEKLVNWMLRVKAPYNVNRLTLSYASKALDKTEWFENTISQIIEQRDWLAGQLHELPGVERVFPSSANFLLVKIPGAYEWYQKLAAEGVIVRYRGNEPHCEETLRISVGTPEQNRLLISTLKQLMETA